MNTLSRYPILILTLLLSTLAFGQWPLRDTVEVNVRNGMPNFFNKLGTSTEMKIAYFGGSITEGNYWRPELISWFESTYPNISFMHKNLGVGGTESKYGVFRIDKEMLQESAFDLVFVEFALNDHFSSFSDAKRSIEGIIQKIWQKNPHTDICFIYTVYDSFLTDIQNGKSSEIVSIHDSIASYYGIPSINYVVQFQKLITSDVAVFSDPTINLTTSLNSDGKPVLTKDRVHPSLYGNEVNQKTMLRAFKRLESVVGTYTHEIKEPFVEDSYGRAISLPVYDSLNTNMQIISQVGQRSYLDKYLVHGTRYLISENSADFYGFSFTGTEVGISIMIGPSIGNYVIEIDGVVREFKGFDSYSAYYRRQRRFVTVPYGDHQVKVYASPTKLTLDEKEALLKTEAWKKDLRDNPSKYAKSELIFSDVLLFGEIPTPTIQINGSLSFCQGDSVTLTSSERFGNTWSTGETTQAITVKNTGSYYVTLTTAQGSKNSEMVNVTLLSCSAAKLKDASCGITLNTLNQALYAKRIENATKYRYLVEEAITGFSTTSVCGLNDSLFRLSWVTGIEYSTRYSIRLAALVSGAWTNYGSTCYVTTPPTKLLANLDGSTLSDLNTTLSCYTVAGATGYKFLVKNQASEFQQQTLWDVPNNFFKLNWFSVQVEKGRTYDVQVSAKVKGVWQDYGPVSKITIEVPKTQLISSVCNASIPSLSTALNCDAVDGATSYRYLITAPGFSALPVGKSPSTLFRLSWVTGTKPNTTYTIQVAAYLNGNWGPYGNTCTVTQSDAATHLTSASCNSTISSLSAALYSEPVPGATEYKYWVTAPGFSAVSHNKTPDNLFRLSWLTGVQMELTYTIRVAALVNGEWSNYGIACTINTASTLSLENEEKLHLEEMRSNWITTAPNPTSNEFVISSSHSVELNVINELGQVLRKIHLTEENGLQTEIGDLPTGVYFVTGLIQDKVITRKVIIL